MKLHVEFILHIEAHYINSGIFSEFKGKGSVYLGETQKTLNLWLTLVFAITACCLLLLQISFYTGYYTWTGRQCFVTNVILVVKILPVFKF